MSGYVLLFWKPGPHLRLSSAEVARELAYGEEVEGLIDLPVKQILDQLKAAFPEHKEQSGLLVGRGAIGSFETTWTWQHLRIECHDLAQSERERLIDLVETFGCTAYDPQLSSPL
jgi:hypothetical protein